MMPPFATGLFGLSMGDWTTIGTGLASIYLLWQQNQIFRRQNEIFASQAGARPTTKMYRKNCCRLRISTYSSLSVGVEESVGVSILGSATEGIFAWRSCPGAKVEP